MAGASAQVRGEMGRVALTVGRGRFGEGHLEAGGGAAVEEGVGGGWWVVAEDVGGFVGEHEGVEVGEGGGGVFGEAGEGGYVGGVFAG